MPRRDLTCARVLITGASGGIGAALALALARRRARLVLLARSGDRLAAVAESAKDAGAVEVHAVAGDVTDSTDRAAALAAAETLGGLDVLINNAGVGAIGSFRETPAEAFRQVLEVNLAAPIDLIREALPLLTGAAPRASRPLIVQIGSILAHYAIPNYTAYCASKFGLRGFSRALRPELASAGVDLLEVDPGPTASDFHRNTAFASTAPSGGQGRVSADAVADAAVRAMQRGARRIVPSTTGRLALLANRWFPWAVDWAVGRRPA